MTYIKKARSSGTTAAGGEHVVYWSYEIVYFNTLLIK